MRLLADENTDTEWLRALSDDGHDVVRVAEFEGLRIGAPDVDVLESAASAGRVVLTADQSDFADPPIADHEGVVIVADVTRAGSYGVESVGSNARNTIYRDGSCS